MSVIAVLTLGIATACSESPTSESGPGLHVVAGDAQTDTISASLAQGLVVLVVNPDAEAEAGVPVLFNVLSESCPSSASVACYPVLVASASDASAPFGTSVTDTTNSNGRALARVRMWLTAGSGRVAVTVPVFGYADTATFDVLPGAAVGLAAAPRDTLIELADSFQLRAFRTDRGDNPVAGPVALESSGSAVTVNPAGQVSGAAVGRAFVRVRSTVGGAQLVDSVSVDVILNARIAVSALHGPIRLSTLTGEMERVVITGNVNAQDWSPSGDRLVYVDDRGNGEYALSVTDTLGATTQLPVPLRSTWPQYSPDGTWIYFFTQTGNPPQVYRIRPNGTGLQPLLPGSFPAPAPDSTRIAITVAGGVWVGDPVTQVGAVVPNTTSSAIATRWSPDGQWIAYRDLYGGSIIIIRPDGTGKRVIPAPSIGGLSWSPDGSALLGGNADGGRLQLIDTRTDVAVFLPVRGVYPAWKPSGAGLIVSADPRTAGPHQ